MLQIRWRRWLTRRYLDGWLDERAYYRMQLIGGGTDNPDQRISEDLDRFTRQTLSLTLAAWAFSMPVVTLVSFLGILWSLSGPLAIPLGSWGSITIPGYMVWFGVIYAIVGTWLTIRVGRPLIKLNFAQQRYEADFRFSLVRLRENTEEHRALWRRAGASADASSTASAASFGNFWSIMQRQQAARAGLPRLRPVRHHLSLSGGRAAFLRAAA